MIVIVDWQLHYWDLFFLRSANISIHQILFLKHQQIATMLLHLIYLSPILFTISLVLSFSPPYIEFVGLHQENIDSPFSPPIKIIRFLIIILFYFSLTACVSAAWPSVPGKLHFTYTSTEEHTNKNTKPKTKSASR
jgi:hypothetical protein